MTTAYTQLLTELAAVRSSWRTRRLIERLLLAVAAVGVMVLLMTYVDRLAALGHTGRYFAALVIYGSAVAGLALAMQPMRLRYSDDYFAALIEQRHRTSGNRIINAIQLGRSQASAMTQGLIDAIVGQGAAAMDDIDAASIVSSPLMRRAAGAVGIVIVLWAVSVAAGGVGIVTSLQRVLLPGAAIAPYTRTIVHVTPNQTVHVLEGTPLTIEATAKDRAGAAVDHAAVSWTDQLGREGMAAMLSAPGSAPAPGSGGSAASDDGSAHFTHTMQNVNVDLRFTVHAGDASSEPVQVIVDPRPHVDSLHVTYHRPAYTALPDETVDATDGHIEALPGTQADLTIHTSKALSQLIGEFDDKHSISFSRGADAQTWTASLPIKANAVWRVKMTDVQGYTVSGETTYTISLLSDEPPTVAIAAPARDLRLPPDASVRFVVEAADRYGLGRVELVGRVNGGPAVAINAWPNDQAKPLTTQRVDVVRSMQQLKLAAGDRLEYWATALDRNNISPNGPGQAASRHYHLLVQTAEQAAEAMGNDLEDYAAVVAELIRLQRLNRAESADQQPADPLIARQNDLITRTRQLADIMQAHAFPARTIIDELRDLAADPMARVSTLLGSYRDATTLEAGKKLTAQSLPIQDNIVERLQAILVRMQRAEVVRKDLKKLQKTDPAAARKVNSQLNKLASDLDKFLNDMRALDKQYEHMPKADDRDVKGEDLKDLGQADHRLDRWKKWFKDSVDEIAKLPDGFVKDSHLAENVSTIFEEVEKKATPATKEISTPAEENAKSDATKVAEDLEVWMPDKGDSTKWTMEDPPEGKFKVPPATLPDKLQDIVGDLIQDMQDFDKDADDDTGGSGANMQAGWDIADGPISSFGAVGKTGNQLPNNSEISGRSGAGRRGKSSGQMVGSENSAMEGRPTPARTTNEPYEAGDVKSEKQLDPRGSTGGGKKTGAGQRGLQGGTPPDIVKNMQRIDGKYKLMREKMQQVAREVEISGRPSSRIDRALELLQSSQQNFRDRRYEDAARQRKQAIGELSGMASGIDRAVDLSLDKAVNLPADMRKQIGAAVQQPLPQGYEDLVGEYYKALSTAGSPPPTPQSPSQEPGK